MPRIIDLGNGYGRVEGYTSKYASLIFPLTLPRVRRLYAEGHLNKDEYRQTLHVMGFEKREAAWFVYLDSVPVAEWKARLPNARTI